MWLLAIVRLSEPAPEGVVDLAQAWYEMSGLPFVFALWVVRPDFDRLDELDELLYEAAQQGVADIPQIASRYAVALGRESSFWQAYLEQSIHYLLREMKIVPGYKNFKRCGQCISY